MSLPEHKVIREKGLGKEYYECRLGATPVMNFPEWMQFSNRHYGRGLTKLDFDYGCRLTGDNRKNFKELFGKPSFCFSGSHYFHCWYIRLPNVDFIILTAREHGTCYEIATIRHRVKIRKDVREALEFLDKLAEVLPSKIKLFEKS